MTMHRTVVIADLIQKNKYKTIVEVGVYQGILAKYLLNECKLTKYYMVDPWVVYLEPEGTIGKIKSQEEWERTFRKVLKVVKKHEEVVKILRMTSKEASEKFKSLSIDLGFIDARHVFDHVVEDIRLWWPIVRIGGTLSGHDFKQKQVKEAVYFMFEKEDVQFVNTKCGGVWIVEKRVHVEMRK